MLNAVASAAGLDSSRMYNLVSSIVPGVEFDFPLGLSSLSGVQLGAVDVFRHEGTGRHTSTRRLDQIRDDRADDFIITMPLNEACVTLSHSNDPVHLQPGSFAFVTTTTPYQATIRSSGASGIWSGLFVKMSGPLVRQRIPNIDQFCHTPIHVRTGAARIMVSLFHQALYEADSLSERQAETFSGMLMDAIANTTLDAPEFILAAAPVKRVAHSRIREMAKAYIERRLSNPTLDANHIAEHCRVSVRYLHLSFAAESTTVGSYIRDARLECARLALRNPALRSQSIIDIALKWGFNDPGHFSRVYRSKFGKAPSSDRLQPDEA